jgi:3-hydroxyisobutyrate dehydrogenase-like beta-hydroxyacid dehydrogenase
MATVDVLGLGNGAPMAARRIEAGHPVTVWNRTRSRVAIATRRPMLPATSMR